MRLARLSLALAGIIACISCAPAIQYSMEMPDIKPSAKKSLVVIVRPAPEKGAVYNSEKMGFVYVDGLFSAVTTVNAIVVIPVDVGTHYIMAKIDNVSIVKLTVEPGKTCYLIQNVSPVPISAPTPGFGRPSGGLTRVDCKLDLCTADEFSALLQKSKGALRYAAYDKTKPMRNMDQGEKRDYINGYEYWAKTNPDQAKKQYEYMGY